MTQPSGEVMPQPAPANEISCCVTNRGFAADAVTLEGLFKYHLNEMGVAGGDIDIDPVQDAHTTPGTFSPQCGLSGTIVLRGGGCKNAFGWYNATNDAMGRPVKPAANQIYTLVPADLMRAPPNGISCTVGDFCPLATRATSQPQNSWADPLPNFAGMIRQDMRWAGGQIGFALIGTSGGQCPQTKYSQAELNDKSPAGAPTNGAPWVTTLIYQSKEDPNAYYIAFEDQPTCPTTWKGGTCGMGSGTNDGDFNDFVFYVSGISCKEGGKPCTVDGQMGICAGGVTECSGGGMMTTCRQAVMPQDEKCDAVDNDCDGMVDEGDGLCPTGELCDKGTCVHPCDEGEFKCFNGLVCAPDGYCKDPRCIDITCGMDQVCTAGACVGGCDNVKCPHGQVCRTGKCVAPCDGVTCPTGRVCEDGACQPSCGDCRDCASGKTCTTSGAKKGVCFETGCENKTCPAGQVCMAGACKDGCQGVTCPAGQECMMGACTPVAKPDAGVPPLADAGVPPPVGGGGTVGTTGRGGTSGNVAGTTGTTGTAGTTGAGGTSPPKIGGVATCGCDTAEGPGMGSLALLLGAFGIFAVRRRAASSLTTARASRNRRRG